MICPSKGSLLFFLSLAPPTYPGPPKQVEPKWKRENRNQSCSHASLDCSKKWHEIEIIHSIDKNLLSTYSVHRMRRSFMGSPKVIPRSDLWLWDSNAGWHSRKRTDTGVRPIWAQILSPLLSRLEDLWQVNFLSWASISLWNGNNLSHRVFERIQNKIVCIKCSAPTRNSLCLKELTFLTRKTKYGYEKRLKMRLTHIQDRKVANGAWP